MRDNECSSWCVSWRCRPKCFLHDSILKELAGFGVFSCLGPVQDPFRMRSETAQDPHRMRSGIRHLGVLCTKFKSRRRSCFRPSSFCRLPSLVVFLPHYRTLPAIRFQLISNIIICVLKRTASLGGVPQLVITPGFSLSEAPSPSGSGSSEGLFLAIIHYYKLLSTYVDILLPLPPLTPGCARTCADSLRLRGKRGVGPAATLRRT
jgi:hypothetical protein